MRPAPQVVQAPAELEAVTDLEQLELQTSRELADLLARAQALMGKLTMIRELRGTNINTLGVALALARKALSAHAETTKEAANGTPD